MSDIAIRVENLSKRYRIGLAEEKHDTFAGALTSFVRSPLKNLRQLRRLSRLEDEESEDIIWALKDVSFEVKRGEVMGIIGRNGAGKSTLLKILSRITEPTSGRVEMHGRVSSLLEVGTGFHPELTGRENIYLNGTILGMRKIEIDRKLDEIVDFSGVERFIDTPVKRYSSGMRVRLAFSVAAHLEPEILLVDEVLAVGDAEFQKKCLGKMKDVSLGGKTVLFVSHNMGAIQTLCEKCILLDSGMISVRGAVHKVIESYMSSPDITFRNIRKEAKGGIRFVDAKISDTNGNKRSDFLLLEDFILTLEVRNHTFHPDMVIKVGITLERNDGVKIFQAISTDSVNGEIKAGNNLQKIQIKFTKPNIYPGSYHFNLWLGDRFSRDVYHVINSAIKLNIIGIGGHITRNLPPGKFVSFFSPVWEIT